MAVEVGRLSLLQIGEESSDPGRKVLSKQIAIGAGLGGQSSIDQPGHDLAQDRRVIFRLGLAVGTLDAEPREQFPQPRQRALMQESR